MTEAVRSQAELKALLDRPIPKSYAPLGGILVRAGIISSSQLDKALRIQHDQPGLGRLGQILVQLKLVTPLQMTRVLADQLSIPLVNAEQFEVDARALQSIPERTARSFNVMPLMFYKEQLIVAVADPTAGDLLNTLHFITGQAVEPVLAEPHDIELAISRHYGTAAASSLPETDDGDVDVLSEQRIKQLAEEKPTVRFVDNLLHDAIGRRASDIHVRPREHDVGLYIRVDGVLIEVHKVKRASLPAIVSRIKIMGGMNIAEHRLPQDGRHKIRMDDRQIDLRLSVIPTVHGESVVIRILDTSQSLKQIADIGFSEDDKTRFRGLINHNQGILLVTGPTGSGKSTTLYAALNALKDGSLNIITVEDPVEYQVSNILQIQVKPQIGYTFAKALRHILRHDPDVIMVGEIRDQETAFMAVESALTGHLVLSTLHTNSAAATLTRLLEIGIAPYLINACLLGVLAQRLVRRNCPHCLVEENIDAHIRETLELADDEHFYVGQGCEHCHGLGFSGRVATYELLEATPALRALIQPSVSALDLEAQAIRDGMKPLTEHALSLARQRLISLSEVYRVRLD